MRIGVANGAAVEDAGDVGMVHESQGLTFCFKPGDHLFGVHAQLDDLEGNLPANWFGLFSQIYYAAATVAQFLEQLITPDPVAWFTG